MRASTKGHTETVKFLLEEGAKVDLPDKVRNSSQLMEVVCIHIINCACMSLGQGPWEGSTEIDNYYNIM